MKIGFRLGFHFIRSLCIGTFFMSIFMAIFMEGILPLIGIGKDDKDTEALIVFSLFICTLLIGAIVYGWHISKPLFRMISWINQLAEGSYVTSANTKQMYKKKTRKLKGPYRLYKDVFLNIEQLTNRLREIETEREQLEKMKREWMAGISHDLKTPLTYITGYSALMLSPDHTWSHEEKEKFLQEIQQKGDHMKELIEDLNLSFRLQDSQIPLRKEEINIVEFTRRLIADITNDPRSQHYHFSFESINTNIMIPIDTKLFHRSLQNLFMNAILHNPPETKIHTSILLQEDIHIIIEDTGAGMDELTVQNLFKQYYRGTNTNASNEGTGLGMTIAHKIITAHGGTIRVTSKIGTGSKIHIILSNR
ncbi:HAMP domain-containing histidine kinase [Bacillus sp. Xin]|uniref:sensor histidine kinase n=1 Tax=unclassified Bacillus (in: firmicutes) TaxID=185979 RepID=UPI001573E2D4|nr:MULTISPECIES: HAMP domain-containing sensor histidine kinase [unclassified Bacillus (in: firmicutes)]MBC6972480.1 HAMP domain-containing histidine kinase [Bacillus sp. Xin]NSW37882.1 HAMP domain-containing histidine kinase [Bacillus sp. Xin1]